MLKKFTNTIQVEPHGIVRGEHEGYFAWKFLLLIIMYIYSRPTLLRAMSAIEGKMSWRDLTAECIQQINLAIIEGNSPRQPSETAQDAFAMSIIQSIIQQQSLKVYFCS